MSRRSSAYDVDAAAGHGLDDSPARGAPVRSSSRPRSSRAWRQRSRRDEGADADVASSRSAPRQRPAIPAKERSRLLRSTRDSERSSSPVLRESDRSGSTAARRGHSRAPSTPSLVDDQEQSRRTSQPLAAATPGSARSRLSREASASSGSVARPTVFRSATVPSTILGMIAERDEASEPADDEARRRASTKFLGDGADMEDAASTLHNSSRRASRRGESRQCDEDETGSHLSLDRLVKRVHVVPGGIPAMSAINEEQLSRASSGV
ncbi:unnamed protein product [Pedinophyceae sp. YPF-701]|nr:unnamed protein product [Pedinophyceae sp. YPF-701]